MRFYWGVFIKQRSGRDQELLVIALVIVASVHVFGHLEGGSFNKKRLKPNCCHARLELSIFTKQNHLEAPELVRKAKS